MKDQNKKYWKGIEQLYNDPEYLKYADKEFPDYLPVNKNKDLPQNEGDGPSRRDFLKLMGFGVSAAALAACEAPVRKAIPYLNKPPEVDPGVPNYFASTYAKGGDYCSVVVKTREGRPIKIEGNKMSSITKGATSARVEASVLSLYDNNRYTDPQIEGNTVTWEELDKKITSQLRQVAVSGGQIRIVSNTILSPTTLSVIDTFKAKYPNTKHVVYDPASASGILEANRKTLGKSMIPSYDFSKAEVIVSFGADFLGTWLSPIEYTKQYVKTRKVSSERPEMSRHYQFESNYSVTGANADYRIQIKPSQEGVALANLYNLLASKAGAETINTQKVKINHLEKAANELWASRGKTLVVSGSNDWAIQALVNNINRVLNNYRTTIITDKPSYYRQGNDRVMSDFINEVSAGEIAGVIFLNCNPVYNHPQGAELLSGLSKVKLKIATATSPDETTSGVNMIAPDHHYLESWDDAQPRKGVLSLSQPAIRPIFNTRQAQSSLLAWSQHGETDYYEFLRSAWENTYYPQQTEDKDFQIFWDKSLYDGVREISGNDKTPISEEKNEARASTSPVLSEEDKDLEGIAQQINKVYKADNQGLELAFYRKVGIGDGEQANNPWLQEMPDPITRATWDNYLTISMKMANEMGIEWKEGWTNFVNLTINGKTVKVPALVQPGQAEGTVGLALGYGRKNVGYVGNSIGVDAYPLLTTVNEGVSFVAFDVSVEVLPEKYQIAQTQIHETYMGRDNVIQETLLSEYKKDAEAGRYMPKIATSEGKKDPEEISLWHGWKYQNHHWGMAIDMNSCVGCGACTIACQAENNIPVVGRREVINRREMHWIRIDRYYSSKVDVGDEPEFKNEKATENPQVTFQPMMCQHCNNAPCETVCPVSATTHSTEGLNQMTYNRCIGTRYCANNCPYKVRRFNWFKYHENDKFSFNTSMYTDLGMMVLNPDVTVRSRGVMEKCSLCVQRIQAGKLAAKREGRRPKDGEINTACAVACPGDAILFGDMNDENSRISKKLKIKQFEDRVEAQEARAYNVLEEINTRANVYYLTKIRNQDKA